MRPRSQEKLFPRLVATVAVLAAVVLADSRVVEACVCADIDTFLQSIAAKNVSVLRIRILARSAAVLGGEVFDQLLGVKPSKRRPGSRSSPGVVLVASVVEQLSGSRAPAEIRVEIPNATMCGPADAQFVEGSEWYIAAVLLRSKQSVPVRYVMWAPCGVPAIRVAETHVVGAIRGKSEELPLEEFRSLVRARLGDLH